MKKIHFFLLAIVLLASSGFITNYWKTHKTLLIIGCARSGTTYIADVLQKGGLQIGHERMKRDGISSWDLTVNPKKGRWKVCPEKFHFAHIFHQVRDPLKCISSVYKTEDQKSWNYILAHMPEIHDEDSHLVKCAKYWYFWNLKAEERAEWTYRVEDIDLLWDEFEKRLGKKIRREHIQNVPKDTNTKGAHADFTWEDLQKEIEPNLYRNIQLLAQKYGYIPK